MFTFHQNLIGTDTLLALALFAVMLALGWLAIHVSFATTARTLAARATADLASVHAALAGLSDRVSRLEAQVAAVTARLDRCEPATTAKTGTRRRAKRGPDPPPAVVPEGAAEGPP